MSHKYTHYNHCNTPNTTTSCDDTTANNTKDSTCYSVLPSSCTNNTSCISSSSSSCSSDTFNTKECDSYNTCTKTCTKTCSETSKTNTSMTCTTNTESNCLLKSKECDIINGASMECDEKVLGKKKFCVTFDHKKGHRFADEIEGDKTIHINGKNAPILKVKRGYMYYFVVDQKQHHGQYDNLFVLTKSPVGLYEGHCPKPLNNSFDPVGSGCVKYFVNSKTPKYFYYQSTTHAFLGNLVIVE